MSGRRRKRRESGRPRVLVVGDAVVPTGFARVLHSLLSNLEERYEFHHLGINYRGEAHGCGWEIYPAGADGDFFGTNRLGALVDQIRPQLVFLLNDPWVLGNYMGPLRERQESLKVLAYSPVDAGPIEPGMVEPLQFLDRFVAYTRYGRREIEQAVARVREHDPGFPFPPMEVIPHGVDTGLFFPYSGGNGAPAGDLAAGRTRARAELFGRPEFEDAWIVLNANRNQPRKRIDVTIKGFALFARDKPENVRLYLHMGVEDIGWNVVYLARRHGIEDRLILTADEKFLPAVPDEVLNRIYNACDVGLNTSLGEGWGLVNLEHAATGAAQVVPRHSACEEIWTGSAVLLEPALSLTAERILTEGKLVAPEEVAHALEGLYRDPGRLAEMSAAALAVATRREYRWSAVAEKWHRLFQEVLAEG
ncbi:MAG TPA: glycosyltransferase family 4 protein [Thermoanaerobaculia bacterium]|nr:glycosyltransferase family 4 protein [Thermoanaerobaculia bacterium]